MVVCRARSSCDSNVISRRWSRIRETAGGILSAVTDALYDLPEACDRSLGAIEELHNSNDPYIRRGRLALSSLKLGREGHSRGTTAITRITRGEEGEGGGGKPEKSYVLARGRFGRE